jgi:hypothetical protein
MAATTEATPTLDETRAEAFDAAADLRSLGRAHDAALLRIRALEQGSLVRRPALDAAIDKLLPHVERRLEALVAKNVRPMVFGELPSHVADEMRTLAGDVARLEVLRRAAATVPDDAFFVVPEFTVELRVRAARLAQRRLVDEVMASYRPAEVITGLLDALEKTERAKPGEPEPQWIPGLPPQAQPRPTHVTVQEREAFEAARAAKRARAVAA